MPPEVGDDDATESDVTNAERLRWRLQWLECLRDFADLDLQCRMWLDSSNTNPHWSFVEFMCTYFNDTLHQRDYSWALGQGLVTPEEAEAVASLHQALVGYDAPNGDDFDNLAVLRDPAWRAITVEAARSLEHLSALLTVPVEGRIPPAP